MSFALRQVYSKLVSDRWRASHPFSSDIQAVHEVLFHPFASRHQKSKALLLWMKKYQPCIFGRIAAQMGRVHVCILSELELALADEEIQDFVQVERMLWKQRCLRNEFPEHGFLLVAATPRVALASPNSDLYEFSRILREMCRPSIQPDLRGNDIAWETLFLQHPETNKCYRFTFSLDYFAAQGDQRWWHDHRIPGGIGYTANSVGHMLCTREWYEKRGAQIEWVVRVAMETVDESAETIWGKAIKLKPLKAGQPFHESKCPFRNSNDLKPRLQNRDWSVYEGTISTDHSLRKELFTESPEPDDDLARWNMDFSYLYDGSDTHKRFVTGEEVSCDDVLFAIGDPSLRRILGPTEGEQGDPSINSKLMSLEKLCETDAQWD
jgi:hypothetical protein